MMKAAALGRVGGLFHIRNPASFADSRQGRFYRCQSHKGYDDGSGAGGLHRFVQCSGVAAALEAAPMLGRGFEHQTKGFILSSQLARR